MGPTGEAFDLAQEHCLTVDQPNDVRPSGLASTSPAKSAPGWRHRWWAFESFSALDCCLVTDHAVIVVEQTQ